jgi:hypothetical protein
VPFTIAAILVAAIDNTKSRAPPPARATGFIRPRLHTPLPVTDGPYSGTSPKEISPPPLDMFSNSTGISKHIKVLMLKYKKLPVYGHYLYIPTY